MFYLYFYELGHGRASFEAAKALGANLESMEYSFAWLQSKESDFSQATASGENHFLSDAIF